VTYHVACRVSGGVTGTRESLLRDGDSTRPKVFASLEEAEAEARKMTRWGNGSGHGTARFDYWAVPA
jgi:hypothetical protein